MTTMNLQRARFKGEKRYNWTIQVIGDRYTILTKQTPFQKKGDLLYTICDAQEGQRGPTSFVGNGWDMQSRGPYIGSRALHVALLAGEVEISHRNQVAFAPSDIEVAQ